MSAMDVVDDQQLRARVYDAVHAVLTDHELLVTPTLRPAGSERRRRQHQRPGRSGWCLTCPLNLTGHPPASIPAGTSGGLPVGMQLVGRRYADADVLAASAAYEPMRPWRDAYRRCQERPL